MQFGDKIRTLRQEKGLTQPELAERLNVEQSWLSKIETNKVMPSREFIQSILNFFEISLEDLLSDFEPEYVKSHLAAIPEVARHLSANKSKRQSLRKKWIIGAAICCVLGCVILSVTFLNVFFPSNQYRYISLGVLYFGEPNELYDSPIEIFQEFGLNFRSVDAAIESTNAASNSMNSAETNKISGDELRQKMAIFSRYVFSRRAEDSFVSNFDLGRYVVQEKEVPKDATNMLGEHPKEARRVYSREIMHNPNKFSGFLYLLGFIFLFSGLFGFVVEYKLAKL